MCLNTSRTPRWLERGRVRVIIVDEIHFTTHVVDDYQDYEDHVRMCRTSHKEEKYERHLVSLLTMNERCSRKRYSDEKNDRFVSDEFQ